MIELEEYITKTQAKAEQQRERKRIRDEAREAEKKRKAKNKMQFIIGGLFLKYFPSIEQLLQQKLKNSDIDPAFVSPEQFIAALTKDKELFIRLTGISL